MQFSKSNGQSFMPVVSLSQFLGQFIILQGLLLSHIPSLGLSSSFLELELHSFGILYSSFLN